MSHRLFSLVCRLLGGEKSTLREAKAIPLVVGWTLASKFSSSSNSSSSSGGGRNCRPLVWGDKSYGRRERSGRTSLLPNRSARCKIMASDDVDRLAEELEDRAAVSSSRGSRGGRFRGGRGGRGGGGKGREVDLSRALSRLLRHQAESAGVTLDAQGFAPLDKVVSCVTWVSTVLLPRREIADSTHSFNGVPSVPSSRPSQRSKPPFTTATSSASR